MNLQKRDVVATGLVAVAGLIYVLWLLDSVPSALSDVRATGAIILALGFAASAIAVVPGFGELLRGNRAYLTVTSLLGLVALVAGVVMLVSASQTALAVVMLAMITMWLIATIHHSLLAKSTATTSTARVDAPEKPRVVA